jgi:hypothetical protein
MSSTLRERFRLIIEALPDRTPGVIRPRHFLKAALRSWGLKCIDAEPVPNRPPPEAEERTEQDSQGSNE